METTIEEWLSKRYNPVEAAAMGSEMSDHITAKDIRIGGLKSDIRILKVKNDLRVKTNKALRDRLEIAQGRNEEFQEQIERLENEVAPPKVIDYESTLGLREEHITRLKAKIEEVEGNDQERVDALHSALYPNGGVCDGYFSEIRQVCELMAKIDELEKWKIDAIEENVKVVEAASELQIYD